MNIFLNEYFGFCFELNFELNHFSARFNEKMNFQNVSYRASVHATILSTLDKKRSLAAQHSSGGARRVRVATLLLLCLRGAPTTVRQFALDQLQSSLLLTSFKV